MMGEAIKLLSGVLVTGLLSDEPPPQEARKIIGKRIYNFLELQREIKSILNTALTLCNTPEKTNT